MWSWDGIHGESLIFSAGDVSGLTDEDFKGMLIDSNLLKYNDKNTVTRKQFRVCELQCGNELSLAVGSGD
jgi:hypothetical protein